MTRNSVPLTIETVNLDDRHEMDEFDRQVIAAGMARVRAEVADLQRSGLLDGDGKLIGLSHQPGRMKNSTRLEE